MKRWKYSVPALFLALALSLSLLPGRALAASHGGTLDHFSPVRTYDEQFSDVPQGEWYHDNVAYLYEVGLTNGAGDGSWFGSDDLISVAEVVTFAARASYVYRDGSLDALNALDEASGSWYGGSVEHLKELGILKPDNPYEGQYTELAASRAFVAVVLARVLPEREYADLNGKVVEAGYGSGEYIPDLDRGSGYAEDVLALYRAGITNGIGAQAEYRPDASITRKEFTAMLTRLVSPALRVAIQWEVGLPVSAAGMTMQDLIKGPTTFASQHGANDTETIKNNLAWMLQRGDLTLTIHLSGTASRQQLNDVMSAYQDCMCTYYFEQSCARYIQSSSNSLGSRTEVKLVFGFYEGAGTQTIKKNQQLREDIMDCAIAVHDELWSSGTLTRGMTQTEIARVYYQWIADRCVYDDRDRVKSHSAIGLFEDGVAVCDGYTQAYNLLLEIEGIDCRTANTSNHIWTVATLDGAPCHIDTTWGDRDTWVDFTYFCMDESYAYHRPGL